MTLGTSDQVKAAPHDTTRDGGGHAQAEKDGPGLQVQAGRGHHSGTQPPEDEDADGAGWGVLGGCCCSPPSTPSHMVMGVRSRWTQLPGRNGPPAALGWRGSAAQALAGARPACAPQTNCWMVKTSTFRAASCSLPLHPALQSPQPTDRAGWGHRRDSDAAAQWLGAAASIWWESRLLWELASPFCASVSPGDGSALSYLRVMEGLPLTHTEPLVSSMPPTLPRPQPPPAK